MRIGGGAGRGQAEYSYFFGRRVDWQKLFPLLERNVGRTCLSFLVIQVFDRIHKS